MAPPSPPSPRAAIDAHAGDGSLTLRPFLHDVTLARLLKLVFGDRQAPRDRVREMFRTIVWKDMRAWKPWTRLSRLHPELRALMTEELDLRRAAPPRRARSAVDAADRPRSGRRRPARR
jgi:hypothetical protein